jgi:hypothetical protein
MMKKKTWNAGCMILISLMICTILSIRIEKWMQIPVEIATISQTEEEKLNSTIRIPKSCYNTDTNMIFYLAEQEGVFGTKFLAFSKAVDPLSITADSILLPEEKDEKGQLLQIIKWSTYPLKDGDEVTIDQEGEHKKQSGENRRILEKQKSFFFFQSPQSTALQQPHARKAQSKAKRGSAHNIADMVHAGQHTANTDEHRDAHHRPARLRVEIHPYHGQHGSAQRVAGWEGVAPGLLVPQRFKAGLFIGTRQVQPVPQDGAAPEGKPRHEHRPRNDGGEVQRGLTLTAQQPKQPDVQQAEQHRITYKRDERQPAVQCHHTALGCGVGIHPAVQGVIMFCGQKRSLRIGHLKN